MRAEAIDQPIGLDFVIVALVPSMVDKLQAFTGGRSLISKRGSTCENHVVGVVHHLNENNMQEAHRRRQQLVALGDAQHRDEYSMLCKWKSHDTGLGGASGSPVLLRSGELVGIYRGQGVFTPVEAIRREVRQLTLQGSGALNGGRGGKAT